MTGLYKWPLHLARPFSYAVTQIQLYTLPIRTHVPEIMTDILTLLFIFIQMWYKENKEHRTPPEWESFMIQSVEKDRVEFCVVWSKHNLYDELSNLKRMLKLTLHGRTCKQFLRKCTSNEDDIVKTEVYVVWFGNLDTIIANYQRFY